ncbi:hypothetical protein HDC90_004336 [Pedobacter sp. AK013]|uniref:hypothetical protein n=1 Tax=Pedobacter sp. AK013 TaxID=2723071 RepID=UPI00160DCAF1|nr:hypothetical protein [Pedobacter sp. AK013]MBB6239678.1 hypothetical protein [Pedobacter sp. AK013]
MKNLLISAIATFLVFIIVNNVKAQVQPDNPEYMAGWNYYNTSMSNVKWNITTYGASTVEFKNKAGAVIFTSTISGYDVNQLSAMAEIFRNWQAIYEDLYQSSGDIYYRGASDLLENYALNPGLMFYGGPNDSW